MPREDMELSDRLGRFVARNPRKIVAVFLALFAVSLPALGSLSSFISFSELLPEGEYYDANIILNRELGSDNVMFLLTTPAGAANVTEVDALREIDHIMSRFDEVEYVETVISLPGLVRTLNYLSTGNYEFPPDTPAGDRMAAEFFAQATTLYGEALIYDNLLARDGSAGIGLIVMEKGHDLQTYRDWQVELKEIGLEIDENNPYADQTENRPISIDVIYANLDNVAVTEGPLWILVAAVVAAVSSFLILDKKLFEMLLALFVLTVAIAVTITAGYLVGVHFNLLSMLLIALILGAGIDYAMHVIARYQEERKLGYGVQEAITQSTRHVGAALFITTVTTVVGFMSLYFSRIQAIGQFGVMVGAGMFTAYLACILLLPALIEIKDGRRQRRHGAEPAIDKAEAERRRHALEAKLREEQSRGTMGRLARWNQRHHKGIIAVSVLLVVGMGLLVAMNGVMVWGGSYIEPPILDSGTYPMETLTTVDETVGIPVEGAVVVRGDMTRPANLVYLERIEDEMLGRIPGCDADDDPVATTPCYDVEKRDHGILNGMSTVGVVRLLYSTLGIPNTLEDDRWAVDADGDGDQDACAAGAQGCPDGIPDTSEALAAFYDRLYDLPTVQGVMYRVLSDDYGYGVVRYNYAAQPRVTALNPEGSLGTDMANYKAGYADLVEDIAIVQGAYEAEGRPYPETLPASGLVASAVAVNGAIIRGNSLSTYAMLVTTFGMIYLFWRRVVPTLITMIPVLASVAVQYFIISLMGWEITYVSIILTGMALGIGIDDAVHLVSRFKEEMTNGRKAEEAAALANSEIGRVLIATTVTTLAPFFVITTSAIVWAKNTAWMTIPTLSAALVATIFLLPVLLRWHGSRWPAAWVTATDLRRAGIERPPQGAASAAGSPPPASAPALAPAWVSDARR